VKGCATLGNALTTYHGPAGDVAVDGYIERTTGLLSGLEVQYGERRHQAVLLVEDIGAARAGDRLTDEDGVVWFLNDELDNDGFVVTWSVEQR
jgi:hypothetical protein